MKDPSGTERMSLMVSDVVDTTAFEARPSDAGLKVIHSWLSPCEDVWSSAVLRHGSFYGGSAVPLVEMHSCWLVDRDLGGCLMIRVRQRRSS